MTWARPVPGQAKALKFAMDLAQKAMRKAERRGFGRDWMQVARHMMPEMKRPDVKCTLFRAILPEESMTECKHSQYHMCEVDLSTGGR